MARNDNWPVVRPLPALVVKLGLAVFFVLGCVLIWKDRSTARLHNRKDNSIEKPIGLPAFK